MPPKLKKRQNSGSGPAPESIKDNPEAARKFAELFQTGNFDEFISTLPNFTTSGKKHCNDASTI